MRNKKKKMSTYKRKLTIDNEEWTYRVTHKTIDVCSPDRKQKWKIFIDTSIDLICDCDFPCQCFENKPRNTQVTPSFVKNIIEKKIIENNISWIKIGTKEAPIGVW